MKSNELRRLSRKELLELLIEQQEVFVKTQAKLEAAQAELNDKSLVLEKAGTMSEAALVLNGVFEAADNAAKQYLENIKQLSDLQTDKAEKQEAQTRAKCEKMLEEAEIKAQAIIAQAEDESRNKKAAADEYLRATMQSVKELLNNVHDKALVNNGKEKQ